MEKKIWILTMALLLAIAIVHADCDEERIRLSVSDLIAGKTAELGLSIDNSFKAYETYNSKQLGDTVTKIHEIMKQGAYTALIALFGMVFLSMSIWSLIKMKQEKNILLSLLNEVKDERKAHAQVLDKMDKFMLKCDSMIQEQPQPRMQPLQQQEIPVPTPPKKEKRGFLGLFKGKKEKAEVPVQGTMPQQQAQPQQVQPQYAQQQQWAPQPVRMQAQEYDPQQAQRQAQQEQAFQELQKQLLEKYDIEQKQKKAYMEYQAQLRQQAEQQIHQEMLVREQERMSAEQEVKRLADELEAKKKALKGMR